MNNNSSSNGTLILVLGILSLICLPILGPVAWILGNNAINAGVDESQRGTINAGRICGIIGTVFMVIGVIYWIFVGSAVVREAAKQGGLNPGTTITRPQ